MNLHLILSHVDAWMALTLFPLLCVYVFLGLDDALLDLYAWLTGAHAGKTKPLPLRALRRKKQKRIAVIVAAWKESAVIARMVRDNLQNIEYQNYDFFVGVYPNDTETVEVVTALKREVPNLYVVINTLPGPTSKGQMLNQVVREVFSRRTSEGHPEFDVVLCHDSEDIIHPYALLTINAAMDKYDFVQVPVFSLAVEHHQWVAGIYMDEFAEFHTKDIRVRNKLAGCFPAAGVGMAIARSLVERYLLRSQGQLFNEASLTEDYELGLTAKEVGGKSQFICAHYELETGKKTFLATREFFPKRLKRSIRQKTRWTVGIAFQGWEKLGWRGCFWQHYFFYRDRKGPWANMAVFVGMMIWIYATARWGFSGIRIFEGQDFVENGFYLTSALMVNRMFQKMYACGKVYGWVSALFAPVRTIGANVINSAASVMALKQYIVSRTRGVALKWVKTDHELPEGFGAQPISASAQAAGRTMAAFLLVFAFLASSSSHAQQTEREWVPSPVPERVFTPFYPLPTQFLPLGTRDARFECVHIYYDATKDPAYVMSRYYAVFLQNLLAHFPQFQQIVEPIENYRQGDIESCRTTFYIGSYFDSGIPREFFSDFASTKKNVVWMGYSIWKYPPAELEKVFGAQYLHFLTSLNWDIRDPKGQPTFYKDILYKGETFPKYGAFNPSNKTEFRAAFEIAALKVTDPSTEILATARQNGTGDVLPYAIRKGDKFYLADIPFSFMHEGDRYLIFADLLFDMLDVKPRYSGRRPAVFRFEDIHARVPTYQVRGVAKVAREFQVPLHIALIPIFRDPLYQMERAPDEDYIPMHNDARFMSVISELKQQETAFIWHGVTHQYGTIRNPNTGASGDDFEFWDINNNRAIPEDAVSWVLNRLNDGWYSLQGAGITPQIWEVPHYQSSGLDYSIFARVFPWNIGRVIYRPIELSGQPAIDSSLWYPQSGLRGDAARKQALQGLQVHELAPPSGQFFPYEIYGDIYGQNVLPEDLGNPQPYVNTQVSAPRSIDDILRDARKNLKLRDVWGSLFFHPQLLDTRERDGLGDFPGDTKELERLLREMKAMGYEFINLEEFVADKKLIHKPETVYVPLRGSVQ